MVTSGTPVPGLVLAPTKYMPSTAFDTIGGRKYPTWKMPCPMPNAAPSSRLYSIPPVFRRPHLLVDHTPTVEPAPALQQPVDLLLEGATVAVPVHVRPEVRHGDEHEEALHAVGGHARLRLGGDDGVERGIIWQRVVPEDGLEVLLVAPGEVEIVVHHVPELPIDAQIQHERGGRVLELFTLSQPEVPVRRPAQELAVRIGKVRVREHGVGLELFAVHPRRRSPFPW